MTIEVDHAPRRRSAPTKEKEERLEITIVGEVEG